MKTQNAGGPGMAMPSVEEVNWARRLRTDGVQYHRGGVDGIPVRGDSHTGPSGPLRGAGGAAGPPVRGELPEGGGGDEGPGGAWSGASSRWAGRPGRGEEERWLARERGLAISMKSFRAMDRLLGLSGENGVNGGTNRRRGGRRGEEDERNPVNAEALPRPGTDDEAAVPGTGGRGRGRTKSGRDPRDGNPPWRNRRKIDREPLLRAPRNTAGNARATPLASGLSPDSSRTTTSPKPGNCQTPWCRTPGGFLCSNGERLQGAQHLTGGKLKTRPARPGMESPER